MDDFDCINFEFHRIKKEIKTFIFYFNLFEKFHKTPSGQQAQLFQTLESEYNGLLTNEVKYRKCKDH